MLDGKTLLPSPAVAIVGRHNSGKTTLVEKVISTLVARGLDVGSVKHHGHAGFDIDIPGKDSYRHRQAGASETVISCPGQVAAIRTVEGEVECRDLVAQMPGHDIVVVEGYRKSGLPTIEVMRAGNDRDEQVARLFWDDSQAGVPLSTDFVQAARASWGPVEDHGEPVSPGKMPTSATVAVATDLPLAARAAEAYGIPAFDLNDVGAICDFLQERFTRHRVSVVIQAGGESRRMGQSKALVPFLGRPLIMRLVERLAPVADELIITTNEGDRLEFLHRAYPGLEIRLVPDTCDFRGALPGFLTAFSAARNDYVAIVACDMVFASANLVAAECVEMSLRQAAAVVPVNRNGFEPMHALYRRSAVLPVAQRLVEGGSKRAQDIFAQLGEEQVVAFPQARVREAEPAGGCFVNVNTPDELAAVEQRCKQQECDECDGCARFGGCQAADRGPAKHAPRVELV